MPDRQDPSIGDVVISRASGWYALSIVPDRQQVHLASRQDAVRIALAWAKTRGCRVWSVEDGAPVTLEPIEPSESQLNS